MENSVKQFSFEVLVVSSDGEGVCTWR